MKAIFLDRDGVINRYPGDKEYVTSLKKFFFLPRAKEAISKLYSGGYKLFVISNQAGVGKKVYSQKTLDEITAYMLAAIKKAGGEIEEVLYCTHRPRENCSCRKPRAGSVEAIKKKYPISIKSSFFIGDTILDMRTAQAAGCKSILVLSGKEKLNNRNNWESEPDFVFKDLLSAARFILKQNKKV